MNKIAVVLDLSHHNAIPGDYGALVAAFRKAKASGIVGIIHKATQGTGYTDPRYAIRRKAANEAGLRWGAYHFVTHGHIATQVEYFLRQAAPDARTLVALDHESDATLGEARLFLETIEAKLGRKAVIYSGNLLREQLGMKVDTYFGSHRLWHAQYGKAPVVQKSWAAPWLWQFSDGKEVPGMPGKVDVSSFNGTPEQLAASWAGEQGAVKPLPKPPDVPTAPPPPIQPPDVPAAPASSAAPMASFWDRLLAALKHLFSKG